MRSLRRGRAVGVVAAVAALLAPGTVHAVNAVHVEWAGSGWSTCTTGTSSGWTCTYAIWAHDCVEAAVAGVPVAWCSLYVEARVPVVPVVNALGRLVGCTSGGNVSWSLGHADYDSSVDEFDNSQIDGLFVARVSDAFSDGKPGLLEFTAFESGQGDPVAASWLVEGAFTGSCKRGAEYVYGTGSGSVDAAV